MTLIKIGSFKSVASLNYLRELALKKIFNDIDRLEEILLNDSINAWTKKADLSFNHKKQLHYIIDNLIDSEKGGFEKVKGALKKSGLKYRQFYPDGL